MPAETVSSNGEAGLEPVDGSLHDPITELATQLDPLNSLSERIQAIYAVYPSDRKPQGIPIDRQLNVGLTVNDAVYLVKELQPERPLSDRRLQALFGDGTIDGFKPSGRGLALKATSLLDYLANRPRLGRPPKQLPAPPSPTS